MKKLEGLQYATTIDLNTGCYTIRTFPDIQGMTRIVNKFVKFRYNFLYTGMCSLVDIFQAKVDKLITDIESVKMRIDDILFLSKDFFTKHIKQLRIIFVIVRATALKFNAPKCSFGLKEITCLGYVITRDGIKPDPKKVQRMMDIHPPTTTKEV